jgi:hypothetical protein
MADVMDFQLVPLREVHLGAAQERAFMPGAMRARWPPSASSRRSRSAWRS